MCDDSAHIILPYAFIMADICNPSLEGPILKVQGTFCSSNQALIHDVLNFQGVFNQVFDILPKLGQNQSVN